MKEPTRNERIKQIELLLTHPHDVGVNWRSKLVRELIGYIFESDGDSDE